MPRFAIVHDIYEGTGPEPVVRHVFYGSTPAQADGVYRAHLKTDAFLRACNSERGNFGDFVCRAKVQRVRVR